MTRSDEDLRGRLRHIWSAKHYKGKQYVLVDTAEDTKLRLRYELINLRWGMAGQD
jgi:hypothetical protein